MGLCEVSVLGLSASIEASSPEEALQQVLTAYKTSGALLNIEYSITPTDALAQCDACVLFNNEPYYYRVQGNDTYRYSVSVIAEGVITEVFNGVTADVLYRNITQYLGDINTGEFEIQTIDVAHAMVEQITANTVALSVPLVVMYEVPLVEAESAVQAAGKAESAFYQANWGDVEIQDKDSIQRWVQSTEDVYVQTPTEL